MWPRVPIAVREAWALSAVRLLPFRLRSLKGVAMLLSYLALASALELALVFYGFWSQGIEDVYIIQGLGLWSSVIPALVVLSLTMSWLHLTRSFLYEPRARPRARARRRRRKAGRFARLFEGFSRRINALASKASRKLGRLGTAILRGLFILLLGACSALMLILLTAYWAELYQFSGSLAECSPVLSWLISALSGLGEAMWSSEQLRWVVEGLLNAGMQLNKALLPVAEAIGSADPIYKYALAQNALAWVSGLSALMYRRPPVRRR